MQLTQIQQKIFEIRGCKVILDFDLASMYEVPTKIFNQAVRRNKERFPSDFMFQLNGEEVKNLRSQIVTSSWGGRRYYPFAFTEQGIAMLSSVLKSEKAVAVNIAIMRTFVLIRHHALNYRELHEKLQQMEKQYNKNFKEIYHAMNLLLEERKAQEEQKNRERIGFKTKSSK